MSKKPSENIVFIVFIICWTVAFIATLLFFNCCSTAPPAERVIKAEDKIENPQITCLQDAIINDGLFKSNFKYDNSFPPFVTVYVTGKWNSLDNEVREERLKNIGRKWHECNPNNVAQVTIMAYDINNIPVLSVFVMKGE